MESRQRLQLIEHGFLVNWLQKPVASDTAAEGSEPFVQPKSMRQLNELLPRVKAAN